MTDLQQTYHRQVKNPNPVFISREGAGTLKFCGKLMGRTMGFTSCFDFAIHVAHACSKGLRWCMPPVLHHRAIGALLQRLCSHYDPLANRIRCSVTMLATECGLAMESAAGKLPTTRATRVPMFLAKLGLITYQTEYDLLIECCIPTDIAPTPALFVALDVSEGAVIATRRSRVEWENRQCRKQGPGTLGMDELIAKAWCFVCGRFCSYQAELKFRGIKRARARHDVNRERQDIVTLVKRQPTRETPEGCFTANRGAIKHRVERCVKEHMTLSRNRNYSRLATASP